MSVSPRHPQQRRYAPACRYALLIAVLGALFLAPAAHGAGPLPPAMAVESVETVPDTSLLDADPYSGSRAPSRRSRRSAATGPATAVPPARPRGRVRPRTLALPVPVLIPLPVPRLARCVVLRC